MRAATLAALALAVMLGILLWASGPNRAPRLGSMPERGEASEAAKSEPSQPSHTVVDIHGQPIPGVRVQRHTGDDDEPVLVTDSRGQFDCDTELSGTLELQAKGYGRRFASPRETRIVMEPAHSLEGRVVDAGGRPVPDAPLNFAVYAQLAWADRRVSMEADSEGRFALRDLPSARIVITLDETEWWLEGGEYVAAAGDVGFDLVVQRHGRLRGRVVDAEGRPVRHGTITDAERAWLVPLGGDGKLDISGGLVATDERGEFVLEGLPESHLVIYAGDGERRSESRKVTFPVGESRITQDLVLRDAPIHRSFVRLRVEDPDGAPYPGATVRWSRRAWLPAGALRNPDGTAALPPMQMARGVSGYGGLGSYTPESETDAHGICTFEIPLPPGAEMEFFVVGDDTVLPGSVAVATLADLSPEPVTVRLERGVVRRFRLTIHGQSASTFLKLAGRCVEADAGHGIAVFLVDPHGTYRVYVKWWEGFDLLEAAWKPPHDDTVTTYVMPTSSRPLEIDPEPGTLRVLDQAGAPVRLAAWRAVLAWERPTPPNDEWAGVVPADGTLRLRRRKDLDLRIGAPGMATVQVSSLSAEVRLPRAARIRIRMDLPARWRPADWRLDVLADTWTKPDLLRCERDGAVSVRWIAASWGSSSDEYHRPGREITAPAGATGIIDRLPPGPCRVRLWTDGYEETLTVTLREGETTPVVFRGR